MPRMPVQPINKPPIRYVLRPFQRFAAVEASGGILLLLCTVAALIWANSPFAESYFALWETHLRIGYGVTNLDLSLHHWINDGLMAIFFFVVGLEIKRELLVGELSSVRQATLPIMAAIGGMVVPAAIYLMLNAGGPAMGGWGVPMATDIAFALGALTLLGRRIPLSLKVFLTALAIVDDIGAILVIAIFYTAGINWFSLALGGVCLALLILANWAGVRRPHIYVLVGLVLWVAFLQSGIHATIAGVLLALTIPGRARIDSGEFVAESRHLIDLFDRSGDHGRDVVTNQARQEAVHELEAACEDIQPPMQRLEHALLPWVTYGIMPVFALANAGVALTGDAASALFSSASLGIILGLVIGKQVGVTLFTYLAVRLGWAALPYGVTWRHIYGAGWLAGIGFTMSLFIAGLAFAGTEFLVAAKMGILVASAIAGVVGYFILRSLKVMPPGTAEEDDTSANDAGGSPRPQSGTTAPVGVARH